MSTWKWVATALAMLVIMFLNVGVIALMVILYERLVGGNLTHIVDALPPLSSWLFITYPLNKDMIDFFSRLISKI